MSNMSYCRHENTSHDLEDVWDNWIHPDGTNNDGEAVELNEYEKAGRARIIRLVREMHEQFENDGTYEEDN